MAKVVPFTNTRPVVNNQGVLTQEARITNDELFARLPITGSGSPEGVVEARQGATYYDLDATTGSIHYVKKLADIGGDERQGWVLA